MRLTVIAVVAVLGLVTAVAAARLSVANGGSLRVAACGVERWDVKTLKDPAARFVNLRPVATTIEKLRTLKVPPGLNANSPRFIPQETKTYKVNALLMSVRREADEDLHLVIADPRVGGSMIVEFPASDCIGRAGYKRIVRARKAIADACGGVPQTVGDLWTLSGTATLAGVAYFDPIHGQGGVAPNGIELHPVVSFASSECTVKHR